MEDFVLQVSEEMGRQCSSWYSRCWLLSSVWRRSLQGETTSEHGGMTVLRLPERLPSSLGPWLHLLSGMCTADYIYIRVHVCTDHLNFAANYEKRQTFLTVRSAIMIETWPCFEQFPQIIDIWKQEFLQKFKLSSTRLPQTISELWLIEFSNLFWIMMRLISTAALNPTDVEHRSTQKRISTIRSCPLFFFFFELLT